MLPPLPLLPETSDFQSLSQALRDLNSILRSYQKENITLALEEATMLKEKLINILDSSLVFISSTEAGLANNQIKVLNASSLGKLAYRSLILVGALSSNLREEINQELRKPTYEIFKQVLTE